MKIKKNRHHLSPARIRAVRKKLGMTPQQFTIFGFSESCVRAWESGRSRPQPYKAVLLKLIERNSDAVLSVIFMLPS